MKRIFFVGLMLLLTTTALFSAPWLGGYRLSFDGYQDQGGQYYGAHLYVEPLWGRNLGLGVSIGGATSFALSSPPSLFESSVELHALDLEHNLFRRPSTLRVSLRGGVVTDFESYNLFVQLDPLVFFFGEKTIKVMGLRLLDDRSWALRLLEITHYFF